MASPILFCVLLLAKPASLLNLPYNVFDRGEQLTKVLVHKTKGSIYVASINSLFMLTPNFVVVSSLTTGPNYENDDCPPAPITCNLKRTLKDNEIKILSIDYKRNYLISCGTANQVRLFQILYYFREYISVKIDSEVGVLR